MDRYPVLSTWSGILRGLGVLAIIIGTILLIIGLTVWLGSSNSILAPTAGFLAAAGSFSVILIGIGMLVWGELIKVFLDIEQNTRNAAGYSEILPPRTDNSPISSPPSGSEVVRVCEKCGTINLPGTRTCKQCWSPLK